MAPPAKTEYASGRPPTRPQATRQMVLGGIFALLGAALAALGLVGIGLFFVAGGAVLFGLGLFLRGNGEAVLLVNRSWDTITRGRLTEAEAMLDRAERRVRVGYLRRVIDVQRAIIAFRRGALDQAMQRADAAVARPLGLVARGQGRVHVASARALRALIRATQGDARGAREDVAEVRRCPEALPEALARAELAEAVVLERSGEREALRKHLAGAQTLLLEHAAPRERAIVRAYQRMLDVKRASVYRESAKREPAEAARDEPTLADWMATVAPAAAPFARARSAAHAASNAAAQALAEPIDPEARRAAEARVKRGGGTKRIGRFLLLYVVLVGVFFGIWQVLGTSPGPRPAAASGPPTVFDPTLPMIVFIALAAGVIAAIRLHAHKRARQVLAAIASIARGDEERGEPELRRLTRSRYPLIAGRAWHELAALAERRAAFAEALDACDRGIGVLSANPTARAVASSILLPELTTQRAFALAATDRDAEAAAEMALSAQHYPAHPNRARAELRVGLVRRVRRGDVAGAAALVADGTDDIPLTLRDEALADIVRAAVHPELAGAGEIERLKRTLHVDARLRRWLETVAPQALAAFAGAGQAPEAEHEAEREYEAEREAEADAEADAEAAPPKRACLP